MLPCPTLCTYFMLNLFMQLGFHFSHVFCAGLAIISSPHVSPVAQDLLKSSDICISSALLHRYAQTSVLFSPFLSIWRKNVGFLLYPLSSINYLVWAIYQFYHCYLRMAHIISLFELGSRYVAQAGLQLLNWNNPPALASRVGQTITMSLYLADIWFL